MLPQDAAKFASLLDAVRQCRNLAALSLPNSVDVNSHQVRMGGVWAEGVGGGCGRRVWVGCVCRGGGWAGVGGLGVVSLALGGAASVTSYWARKQVLNSFVL